MSVPRVAASLVNPVDSSRALQAHFRAFADAGLSCIGGCGHISKFPLSAEGAAIGRCRVPRQRHETLRSQATLRTRLDSSMTFAISPCRYSSVIATGAAWVLVDRLPTSTISATRPSPRMVAPATPAIRR